MNHPTTRLLSVLDLLRAYGLMSATELAEKLEVDARTVRRYIVMLEELGMPVETVHGRNGGYKLRENYKLPPVAFSSDEILSLTLGLMLTQRLGLEGMVKSAQTAIAKVQRVIPVDLQEQVRMMETSLSMETPILLPVASEVIMSLSQATYERRQVWVRYQARDERTSERVIDPYGMVHKFGLWYVAGYCHLRQDLRTFRIDRIQQIRLEKGVFYRPENFDPLRFVENAIAMMPGVWLAEIILLATVEQARRLIPSTMAMLQSVRHGDMQCVKMFCYMEELRPLAHFLLGLPFDFVILSPRKLREELQALSVRAADRATAVVEE